MSRTVRTRRDLCPGVFRPWAAGDGAIVRLRTPGGAVTTAALSGLLDVARDHADGTVLVTSRANLQLRGIDAPGDVVPDEVVEAIRGTGLLTSDTHELVRNIVASPLTGRVGGVADLRAVVRELDARLCAEPDLADLGGRFLFVLDDGRGDVLDRPLDLGLVAVDASRVQLRAGAEGWGEIVDLSDAASRLVGHAGDFARARGEGDSAAWHVDELAGGAADVMDPRERDERTRIHADPVAPGRYRQVDGRTAEVIDLPDGLITPRVFERVAATGATAVVLTGWRSVVVPDQEDA